MADKVVDYKKQYKELYSPKTEPSIIEVPEILFVSITGKGNPNEENGEYKNAVGILYGIEYTIKMSKKDTNNIPAGYFDYVVPPLEGFWWFKNNGKVFTGDKTDFEWNSVIRLPEYVNEKVFAWACVETNTKKKIDTKIAKYIKLNEGLCVQCMHIGSYDNEPETIENMHKYIDDNGLVLDINEIRHHHEIYLSDPRRGDVEKRKTIIRLPVKRK
jgi:hypothetical protein